MSHQEILILNLLKKITKKTKAICVVHYLGIPVNMKDVLKLLKSINCMYLEDCALSIGAHYKIHTGLIGDAGVFSFYPVKHMTTAEGGMIITNNDKLASVLRLKKLLVSINLTGKEKLQAPMMR